MSISHDRTTATSQVLSTATGRTYEREAIVTWINTNHNDPCDRTKHLRVNLLCPNFAVRSMIEVSLAHCGRGDPPADPRSLVPLHANACAPATCTKPASPLFFL